MENENIKACRWQIYGYVYHNSLPAKESHYLIMSRMVIQRANLTAVPLT